MQPFWGQCLFLFLCPSRHLMPSIFFPAALMTLARAPADAELDTPFGLSKHVRVRESVSVEPTGELDAMVVTVRSLA